MILETTRLRLREFTADDWTPVIAYQSDPRFLEYYAWTHRTPDDVKAFVGMFLDYQGEQPRIKYQLAIELKDAGHLIGNCGLRMDEPDAHEADIGYEIAPEWWGKGFATEAAEAMIAFGFRDLGLHRLRSWCIAENAASARVLEKLGMHREGRLRENEYFKGRWWDTLLYGMVESDWAPRQR